MIHKRIWLTIFLFASLIGNFFAQKSVVIEINTTPYVIDGTYRAIAGLNFGVLTPNHFYSIGPTILYTSDVVSSNENYPKLTGVQIGYSYFPNGHERFWNMNLNSRIMIQNIADKWTTILWDDENNRYEEFEYLSREVLTTLMVGYGLHLTVGRNLVISQNIGVGLYYSYLDGDEISANAPEISETFGASYNAFGYLLGTEFAIKYKFNK